MGRPAVVVVFNGERQRLRDLAERHGINPKTVTERWRRKGRPMKVDASLFAPVAHRIKAERDPWSQWPDEPDGALMQRALLRLR